MKEKIKTKNILLFIISNLNSFKNIKKYKNNIYIYKP